MRKDILTMYADFETTVNNNSTQVVLAGSVLSTDPLVPEVVKIDYSLDEFMKRLITTNAQYLRVYFHNEKFDGSFILNWLFNNKNFKPDYILRNDNVIINDSPVKFMKPWTFRYMINKKNIWYNIIIKLPGDAVIYINDSYNLMPMSIGELAVDFECPFKKLDNDYNFDSNNITLDDINYLKNDVLILKFCLEELNIDKLTIGSACMSEFKGMFFKFDWNKLFPDLTEVKLPDIELDGLDVWNKNRSADSFVRRAYDGGYVNINNKIKNKVIKNLVHLDSNSHYASVMHSSSGNLYPIGRPKYFVGNNFDKNKYYFVRLRCICSLKNKCVPTIRIKDDPRFKTTGSRYLVSSNNNYIDIVLTCTDYQLFLENYNISNLVIIEGLEFKTQSGMFDRYIDKWYDIKMNNTGAKRAIAKLFLNNLAGKFGTSNDVSYKIGGSFDNRLKFITVNKFNGDTIFTPIAAAITSYGRNVTVRYIKSNIDNYVYSDTDSIVLSCNLNEVKDIKIDSKKLGFWKLEGNVKEGIFIKNKTYIEEYDDGTYVVRSSGMSKKIRDLIENKLSTGEMKLKDFCKGFSINGNLKLRQLSGGAALVEETFVLK